MGVKFLTAEWRKLIMANYFVDPEILRKYLPYGTEPDSWNGNYYVSLVGFMFVNTKVMNVKIPFHTNFPEVNLRFYVRYNDNGTWKRGVVFLKEIVPRRAITLVANFLYKEKYVCLPVKQRIESARDNLHVGFEWKYNGLWNEISVNADPVAKPLQVGSEAEFITEHFWGYSLMKHDLSGEYQVAHPRWDVYDVKDYTITCDFEGLYGKEFGILNGAKPESVFMAEGSPIEVFKKRLIRG